MKKYFIHFITVMLMCFSFSYSCSADDHISVLNSDEQNTIAIFDKIAPMVVNIHKINHVMNLNFQYLPVETGTGSGILWDDKGHIITNYHVVDGANEVIVTFKNGKIAHARIVGSYPRKDIAVLAINSSKELKNLSLFQQFPIADSTKLRVGQNVIAIGNPFGLDHTLTRGIVSALNRQFALGSGQVLGDLIQTDASINPGNSGGPLLNSQGALIGMTTAIYSTSGSSAGIGFAIPSNDIKRITDQIIQHGKVTRAGIGVVVFSDAIARQLGVEGALINSVKSDSPAFRAGLQGTKRDLNGEIVLGDLITAVNQHPVKTVNELLNLLDAASVGEKITITVIRKNKTIDIDTETSDLDGSSLGTS